MKKYSSICLISLVCLTTGCQAATVLTNLNLVSSNTLNLYIDSTLRKSTNPPTINSIVGIRGSGPTNYEYKTLVATNGTTITHSGTNIFIGQSITNGFFAAGSVSNPSLAFSDAITNGLYLPNTNSIGVTIRGTNQLNISTTNVIVQQLQVNNSLSASGVLTSSTYVPLVGTLGVVNIDSVTSEGFFYTRIGNVVHVVGQVDVDPTVGGAGTVTQFSITLPIASTAVAAAQAKNVGLVTIIRDASKATTLGFIYATYTGGPSILTFVSVEFIAVNSDAHTAFVHFSYLTAD